jgi:flagellar motor switch protein FliN
MAEDTTWDDAFEQEKKDKDAQVASSIEKSVKSTESEVLSHPIPGQASELIKAKDIENAGVFKSQQLGEGSTYQDAGIDQNIIGDIPQSIYLLAGNTKVPLGDIQRWNQGTVVEFDSYTEDPWVICVGGIPIAKGDAVVINDKLGIRLTEVMTTQERLNSRKKIM